MCLISDERYQSNASLCKILLYLIRRRHQGRQEDTPKFHRFLPFCHVLFLAPSKVICLSVVVRTWLTCECSYRCDRVEYDINGFSLGGFLVSTSSSSAHSIFHKHRCITMTKPTFDVEEALQRLTLSQKIKLLAGLVRTLYFCMCIRSFNDVIVL